MEWNFACSLAHLKLNGAFQRRTATTAKSSRKRENMQLEQNSSDKHFWC